MKVSKVWINAYSSGKLIGFADVAFTVDDEDPRAQHMVWKGFKLFQGDHGTIQVALPSRKDENGKTENGRPVYYPVISIKRAKEGEEKTRADAFFEYLQGEIEKEYQNMKSGGNNNQGSSQQPRNNNQPAANTGNVGDDDIPF
jgi:DNA-binding cell septation regulator SpoVG